MEKHDISHTSAAKQEKKLSEMWAVWLSILIGWSYNFKQVVMIILMENVINEQKLKGIGDVNHIDMKDVRASHQDM